VVAAIADGTTNTSQQHLTIKTTHLITAPTRPLGRLEFILLMAAMSALDAFSIDAMMPALEQIGDDLQVTVENHRQFVITALFLGFSVGVLFYGFLADRYGRRRPVIAGFIVYGLGSVACLLADSFSVMLAGRVLQGLGAAGPYVLSIAIVRDSFKGDEMARLLSLIMMVFIGIPMIAPFIGQGLLLLAGWRSIFAALMIFALLTLIWFASRQPESLAPHDRQPLSLSQIGRSIVTVLSHPVSCRYLIVIGLLAGAFIAYLSTAQQVFQGMYQLGARFPVAFASLGAVFGVASFANSRLVMRIAPHVLVKFAIAALVLSSLVYLLVYRDHSALPPLPAHLLYLSVMMAAFAFLFGNVTSLAMEPMGHIAGAASSVVNSLSTVIAITIAAMIGSQLGSTTHPVVLGFGLLSAIALAICVTVKHTHNTDATSAHP
jgi:DHA1 family bicyclomycin/chloramphenicol resistance-like MFS transporter